MSGEDFDDFREEDALDFKSRVHALLTRIDEDADMCPTCAADLCRDCNSSATHSDDCALAALLRESGA